MEKIQQLVRLIGKEYPAIYDADVIDIMVLAVLDADTREDIKRNYRLDRNLLSVALAVFDYANEENLQDWEIEKIFEEIFYA